jgi:tol-pal system protein YbgF
MLSRRGPILNPATFFKQIWLCIVPESFGDLPACKEAYMIQLRKSAVAAGIATVLGMAPAFLSSTAAQAQIFGGNTEEIEADIARIEGELNELRASSSALQMSNQRIDDIEESLRRVTGELETLTYQMTQMNEHLTRMQNQIDYIERGQATAALAGEFPLENAVPPGAPSAPELAPGPGTLGAIPNNAPIPTPAAPMAAGDPQAEFDAAMALLTRAQYDRAGEAFRAFSVAHPDTDLGAQALYWTGDIAYSVNNDYQVAARDFAELLRQYPDAPRAPEGMLKLGLSLLALGQKQEGCVTLAALPRTYPNASATIAERARNEREEAACG